MKYSATWSQREAVRKARRLDHAPLRDKVSELLRAKRSREEVAAMLPVSFPRDLRISARPAEAEDRALPGHWEGALPGQHRADQAQWTLPAEH